MIDVAIDAVCIPDIIHALNTAGISDAPSLLNAAAIPNIISDTVPDAIPDTGLDIARMSDAALDVISNAACIYNITISIIYGTGFIASSITSSITGCISDTSCVSRIECVSGVG